MREHLKQYGCEVELGTELREVEQHPDHVVVRLVKQEGEKDTIVTVTCNWIVGTDGGKGQCMRAYTDASAHSPFDLRRSHSQAARPYFPG